jgi:hypothetical protein
MLVSLLLLLLHCTTTRGVKWTERDTNTSPPFNAKVKNKLSFRTHLLGVELSDKSRVVKLQAGEIILNTTSCSAVTKNCGPIY